MNVSKSGFVCSIVAGLALVIFALPGTAQTGPPNDSPGNTSGNGVEPRVIQGSQHCPDLGYRFGFRIGPPAKNGTYTLEKKNGALYGTGVREDSGNSISISNIGNGFHFDWSATLGIDAVIVVANPTADLYVYDPPEEATADSNLSAPLNFGTNPMKIVAIEFCYDYELTVSKTADTSFTRTFEWEIEKTVQPAQWQFSSNSDSGTSNYTVTTTQTGSKDEWQVDGVITIANNTPFDTTVQQVTDVVSPNLPAEVDCDLPYPLSARGSFQCTYTTSLPDGTERTNTATATTVAGSEVGGGEGQAEVVFSSTPTEEINSTVHVQDTNGDSWTCSAPNCVERYPRTFTCEDAGTANNVATIVETGQSADASVEVTCDTPSDLFCLWPPNGKYYCADTDDFASYVEKSCGAVQPGWTFVDCAPDEPAVSGACIIQNGGKSFCVQSDRNGTDSDGRRYTIQINSTPSCRGDGVVGTIWVPHDQSSGPSCQKPNTNKKP